MSSEEAVLLAEKEEIIVLATVALVAGKNWKKHIPAGCLSDQRHCY